MGFELAFFLVVLVHDEKNFLGGMDDDSYNQIHNGMALVVACWDGKIVGDVLAWNYGSLLQMYKVVDSYYCSVVLDEHPF